MKDKWVNLGRVAVDSGQLLVTDPCYLKDWIDRDFNLKGEENETHEYSYDGCSRASLSERGGGALFFPQGFDGAGVCFSTGLGDGLYDVEARVGMVKDFGKRVKEIRIKFVF